MTLAPAAAFAAGSGSPDPISTACGTPLSSTEVQAVIALSDTSTISGSTSVARFDQEVVRNHVIAEILANHQDWRGLFAVGLDAAEQPGMEQLQHTPGAFRNPTFGHAVSPELLRRFLVNVHDEFTGAPEEPQWAQYFGAAHQCSLSPVQVALAGYQAHLAVDVGNTLAAVHVCKTDLGDYIKITDVVIEQGQAIVDATRAAYNVDLAPAWPSLVAGGPTILAADFVNTGLGLNDPAYLSYVTNRIQTDWNTLDTTVS